MTVPNTAERQALLERFARARADARVCGQEPSKYFLDKCGAEAGDFDEEHDDEIPESRPPRSVWALIASIFSADNEKPRR